MKDYIKILSALAKGCKYDSGEVIFDFNDEEDKAIMEALGFAVNFMKKEYEKHKKRLNKPLRNGLPWSFEEDSRLVAYYDEMIKKNIDEQEIVCNLAFIHKRTLGAIVSRLRRKGKLSPSFYINSSLNKKYIELMKGVSLWKKRKQIKGLLVILKQENL